MDKVIKSGSRVFTVAESFKKGNRFAILAGVVYRMDHRVDGIYLSRNTVGGMDSTENILGMIFGSGREDINFILISGAVISWFNIVDLDRIYVETGIPVISVTYEESEGIAMYLQKYFKDWENRLLMYLRLGERVKYRLRTGYDIYIRSIGIDTHDAGLILDRLTLSGRYPEPIRIGRMIASTVSELCL